MDGAAAFGRRKKKHGVSMIWSDIYDPDLCSSGAFRSVDVSKGIFYRNVCVGVRSDYGGYYEVEK